MAIKDRFDFEQQIMKCWNVCDDLDELYEGVLERDMTTDEIANVVLGLKQLYSLKFQTLMEGFEGVICDLYRDVRQAKTYHGTTEDDDRSLD